MVGTYFILRVLTTIIVHSILAKYQNICVQQRFSTIIVLFFKRWL